MTTTTQKSVTVIPATLVPKEKDVRKQNLRVAAYCRVLTDKEEQINSYNSQIEYYTTKISENQNWTLAGIFADEGLSGVSLKKRAQFNKMIQKCRKGLIDLIIAKSLSRFSRNTVDCLTLVRELRAQNIGVIFEKEAINTLESGSDEMILTIMGSLAQAESESLSQNIRMGFRQSFKAGKVPFHYQGFLGYRKGEDGTPEIVPEEAEIVKRIFHRYLSGQSVGAIKKELEADGIPTARGKDTWSVGVLQYMLRNERYIGDTILQKSFTTDVLTGKQKKNNGEQTKYYIHNNHPAIIDHNTFNRVQEEISRRGCIRKSTSRKTKTEVGKYSGKYTLTEILACGCCGATYRRTMWLAIRQGSVKANWRLK